MASLDVLVLGAVRARSDGRDHPLGGAKQRALLARLALARGRAVTPERLIAEIWDERAPRDPGHALQARISRLRSAAPLQIEFRHGGYRLEPASVRLDSALFESLRAEAGRLLADGALAPAAERLHRALELWRGPALDGLPDILTFHTEAVRLEKLRAATLADRIDVDLALGRNAAVIPELHALVEERPFAERHWGQLMSALYGAGRAAESLEVFSLARTRFADGLGVEPSGELTRLHTAILREQPPESLLHLPVAVPVLGDEDAGEDTAAKRRALTSNRVDDLIALLRGRPGLLLTGQAGIGKTHLLRAVSARFEARHCPAPVLSASPLSRTVPLGVFAGAGEPLREDPRTPADVIDAFARHRSRAVLLVDDVECLDDASLFVVTQLIRTSRLAAIFTTRELTAAPEEIRALYDSGDLAEVAVAGLSDTEADEFVLRIVGGPLTPDARPRIIEMAQGNPLHLREIVRGSVDDGRLVGTEHGWELRDAPSPTPRLAQLAGDRLAGLSNGVQEAAAMVAIAGELPAGALDPDRRRILLRRGVLEYAAGGWLRLLHPIDREVLRARSAPGLWQDLTREVLRVLRGGLAAGRRDASRRTHILALDLDEPIDAEATLTLAEQALGALDGRLALRAAEAVAAQAPGSVHAHRIAGLAASSLGMPAAAEEHFAAAQQQASDDAERTAVALARAQHVGARRHDAAGALTIVQRALGEVRDRTQVEHLRRGEMRWAAVAGQFGAAAAAPEPAKDATAVLGLITVAMSGVITGPLSDVEPTLGRLQDVPDEVIELVPGGTSLIELAEIMALSHTGDVVATRRRLQLAILDARTRRPEALGMWEYALGFTELLAGDAGQARTLARSAVAHLEWRDLAGLLPAARALTGAASRATGRADEARREFDAVPVAAGTDPNVVMLRAWADAWEEKAEGRRSDAVGTLLDAARRLLALQHSYFAGMLAHCVVRAGGRLAEAVEVIEEARRVGGGGLLEMFARHGEAALAGDTSSLGRIASEAGELGMMTTAVDTRILLAGSPEPVGAPVPDSPAMALWAVHGGCAASSFAV